MIKRATLSKAELRTVQKIVDIQLDALETIINRDTQRDLTLYCIQCGVEEHEVQTIILDMKTKFQRLKKYPEEIFGLDSDNLETARTILAHITSTKYAVGKGKLFAKFNCIDQLNLHHTLN